MTRRGHLVLRLCASMATSTCMGWAWDAPMGDGFRFGMCITMLIATVAFIFASIILAQDTGGRGEPDWSDPLIEKEEKP